MLFKPKQELKMQMKKEKKEKVEGVKDEEMCMVDVE